MYCEKCGIELKDNVLCCPNCGNQINFVCVNEEIEKKKKRVLTWGILSMVFIGIPGLIFAFDANKKASELEKLGELEDSAKVGKIFAKIGIIQGIVTTIFFICQLIFTMFLMGTLSGMQ